MKTSESIKEIATALAKAQGELEGAKKDSTNPHFKSQYANLASIVEQLKKAFPKHGLSYTQNIVSNMEGAGVETRLMHTSGEWIQGEPFILPATKIDPQGFGSCITYSRRYSLAAASGMAPEDDDDANAASRPNTATQVAKDAFDALDDETKDFICSLAKDIQKLFDEQGDMVAYVTKQQIDVEAQLALWSRLPSNVRSMYKKQKDAKTIAAATKPNGRQATVEG